MIKTFFSLLVLLTILFSSHSFSNKLRERKQGERTHQAKAPDAYLFWINNIIMPLASDGVLADVRVDSIEGGSFQLPGKGFLYSGGFMMSGKSNDTLWANGIVTASRINDYNTGRVIPHPNDEPGVYVIDRSDSPFSSSWQQWIKAVKLGADFYDGNGDSIYNPIDLNGNGQWDITEDAPDLLGDRTAWCVYNDNVPSNQRRWASVSPQGIEIHQTAFAYRAQNELANVLFVRYRIINRGTVATIMDSVYFSPWADMDLGGSQGYTDDLVGCDTLRNAGYTWNDGDDPVFGVQAPASFMPLFQGPVVYIPGVTFIDANGNGQYDNGEIALDTAVNFRGNYLGTKYFHGAKNLGLSSFINYISSDPIHGDPVTHIEARNNMLGRLRNGSKLGPCIDPYGGAFGLPCTSIDSLFWYSGDPTLVSPPGTPNGFGWIFTVAQDVRQMENIGPFTLEQNKPADIIIAYVVGRGTDARNSITVAQRIIDSAKTIYAHNFPVGVSLSHGNATPTKFELLQNYPNPFNSSTTISFDIPEMITSFPFLQKKEMFVSLKIYDMLGREISTVVNNNLKAGKYSFTWNAENVPSGMYFYRLTAGGFVQIMKKMALIK
jgi:hypothetical protein